MPKLQVQHLIWLRVQHFVRHLTAKRFLEIGQRAYVGIGWAEGLNADAAVYCLFRLCRP